MANFIVHMWIKFPPLKMHRNAHVPITPWWCRRELWGHVFGCSWACVRLALPDCLRAAFVPALIWCQGGLAGSWHPKHLPINTLAQCCWGGIKNDPIRGWQCVLTSTTWWGVFKTDFLSFFFLLLEHHLAYYMLYSELFTVAVSSRDVTTFALPYILFLCASFSCLIWTLQHFISVHTRKDPGTLKHRLECSVTEMLSTKSACQGALKWLASI